MSPKTLYSMILWGLILPIFAFPVAGIAPIPAIGYGMIAFAAWRLGAFSLSFRVVSVSSMILMLLTLPTPYLPETVRTSGAVGISSLLLQCVLGWSLFSCVARDCDAHGQIDVAAAARWRRVAYVIIMAAVPLALTFFPLPPQAPSSPFLTLLPLVTILAAYVLLVWTVQSAKIRLFP